MPRAPSTTDSPTAAHGAGRRPDAAVPRPGGRLRKGHLGIVVTDPQSGFRSPQGVTWSVGGTHVTDNHAVVHIGPLFAASTGRHIPPFITTILEISPWQP